MIIIVRISAFVNIKMHRAKLYSSQLPAGNLAGICQFSLGRKFSSPKANIAEKKKAVPIGTTFSFLGWVVGFEPTNTGTTIRGLRPLGDTHHI